ncbi:MAG: hypothetical protein J6Y99_07410 [Bacteroidales bacterium]|nr:hypothetical protein [Bacteroidales bacterium]
MKDLAFGIFIFLFLIGLCVVLGFVTRGTDDQKDKDHIGMTILRGLGTLMMISGVLSIAGSIIYVIYSIFS